MPPEKDIPLDAATEKGIASQGYARDCEKKFTRLNILAMETMSTFSLMRFNLPQK